MAVLSERRPLTDEDVAIAAGICPQFRLLRKIFGPNSYYVPTPECRFRNLDLHEVESWCDRYYRANSVEEKMQILDQITDWLIDLDAFGNPKESSTSLNRSTHLLPQRR